MATSANGGNEFVTGNPLVDAALKRLRDKNDLRFRDIEDAMVVQGHLEKKMGERIREHAELISDHAELIKEHAAFIRSQEQSQARHKERMDEFDDKLSAVISILDPLMRRPN